MNNQTLIIILIIIIAIWLIYHHSQCDSFTLPFAGGYVYGPDYGGIADKEVEDASLMT